MLDEEDIKGEEEGDRASDDDSLEDAAGADTFTKRAARPDAPTSSPRASGKLDFHLFVSAFAFAFG